MNFRKELLENILPFWLRNGVDYENGGIYTCLDKKAIYMEQTKVFGSKEGQCGRLQKRIT